MFILISPAFSLQVMAVDNDYSPENIQNFITHLISKKEYYRACVELQRLNSYYPTFMQGDNVFVTGLYLFFNGERYDELLNMENAGSNFTIKAAEAVFKADVFFRRSEFIEAKAVLDSAGLFSASQNMEFFLYKRTVLSCLLLKKIDEAKTIFSKRNTNFKEFDFTEYKFNELIEYTESVNNSMKNPYSAVALGIIPGLGYAYSGQTETGIIAFVLVTAMSAATYFSFKTDSKPTGVFLGLATTFFYGGSIIGGYLGSISRNNAAKAGLMESLSQKMDLYNDREEIYNKYGVVSVGK
ncbi:MAG: hypothetical protein JW864_01175 [Spirochaetes bacterium]|nr:hypothetical protein [Spirochaetota bacterium]